jgi:hypothetical protein
MTHALTVSEAFGDHYARCSCGAISQPHVTRDSATWWRCPRALAEADVAYLEARWHERCRVFAEEHVSSRRVIEAQAATIAELQRVVREVARGTSIGDLVLIDEFGKTDILQRPS